MKMLFKLLIVSFLVVSFITDARLIRGSGRGGSSGSTADTYYLIDDIHRNSVGIDKAYFDTADFPSAYVTGGIALAYAAPTFCVDYNLIEENRDRAAAGVALREEQPCVWESQQLENLSIFGAYLIFLSPPSLIDVSWTISNGTMDWTLAGFIDDTGTPWLDAPIPADMGIGDYWASVTITQYSGPHARFYHQNVHDSNLYQCDDAVIPEVCGYTLSSSDFYRSTSANELLRIVPTTLTVNTPDILFIYLGGLLALTSLRKRN